MNPKWWRSLLGVGMVLTLVLAACQSNTGTDESVPPNATTEETPEPDATTDEGGTGVEGEIFVSGSSTVEPITNEVARAFAAANSGFQYTVEGPGTGDGFALFCNGETDISDASRAISEEEIAACADNGVEYVELLVAYDGLSVITSAENAEVSCLSFLDLYALLGPESEGFDNWSDAIDLAAELESELGDEFGALNAPYPDAELVITAPGEESGTYDSFVEIVFGDIAEARGTEEVARIDYQSSPNDNTILENIAGSPSSLGWVGLAFAAGAEGVASIEIDGGDGCVAPSEATVADESYPISRPLFIYPSLAAVEANPAVAPFVDYYVSEGLALAGEVGYVPLTEEQAQATADAWEGR
ncbi:MAG: substrate-binding domain-containing protein [Chloroflexi bacterium]|nr:substrate-binding domain-containing protein [Chloroflexota bacterium]